MTASHFIRQSHRWISMLFVLTVIANFVAMAVNSPNPPPAAISYAPLLPLFLLIFSGIYLFVLPYVSKKPA
ncbi:MAG: hypothetical protein DI536_19170 [Archangium gephyra]|uniref:Transmembrane protein n=1 Tax=Archangium gephyra TaxID=48 RepID=A0A2W5TA61_9BACT|nr:MAG: hypothetical protein DI536_19170 [Archangium gephyra]